MGFEPMTYALPRRYSTPELHRLCYKKDIFPQKKLERETRLELATSSLEGWSSTN
jgi:hypothetical protein